MHQKELIFTFDTYKKGVIDIYDLTSTIEAFGKTIETISGLQRYTKEIKLVIEVQALKPSSFEVDINVTFETLQNIAATAITLQTSAPINLAKMVLDILTDVIGIKKFLGGQQPKAVKIDQAGRIPQAIITNIYGVNNTVTIPVYIGDRIRRT